MDEANEERIARRIDEDLAKHRELVRRVLREGNAETDRRQIQKDEVEQWGADTAGMEAAGRPIAEPGRTG